MGDAGNIVVTDTNHKVVLYTHWGGSELPQIVRSGLRRGKGRWNDAPYLTRILFSQLILGDTDDYLAGLGDPGASKEALDLGYRYARKVLSELTSETGYGISSRVDENDHPVIWVDCAVGDVSYVNEQLADSLETWGFGSFIDSAYDITRSWK